MKLVTKYFRALYEENGTEATFISETYEAAVQYARDTFPEYRLTCLKEYPDFVSMACDDNPIKVTRYEKKDQ